MIKDAMTIAKTMKRPLLYICNNYMIGTDNDYLTLSVIEISSDVPRPFATSATGLIDPEKVADLNEKHPGLLAWNYDQIGEGYYINITAENNIYNTIMPIFMTVRSILERNIILVKDLELTENENFQTILSLKSGDGNRWFNVPEANMIISGFSQLYPKNSADRIFCTLYDIDPYSFLGEFTVVKKKYNVKHYIRYRKLV